MNTNKSFEKELLTIEPEKENSLPDIELYMDQLIEFLSRNPISLQPDSRLTSAMVNNYIKSGLLPRAHGKRYSKSHLEDLAMITRLKQVLSVSSTGELINLARNDNDGYYDIFCEKLHEEIVSTAAKVDDYPGSRQALAMELALDSYVKKVACEHLLEELLNSDN